MRHDLLLPVATLAAAAALGLGGCDDDDDGGGAEETARTEEVRAVQKAPGDRGPDRDVRQIKQVVRRFVLANDPSVSCRQVSTHDLVQRIFGDVPQCRKASRPEKGDDPPRGVATSGVRVKDDSATARVRLVGGAIDGVTGTLELRKQGGRWKVDDLGAGLLRGLMVRGLQRESRNAKLLQQPVIKRCVRNAFEDLSDDELKRVAYLALSEREGSSKEVARVMLPCLLRPGSGKGRRRSYLRDRFEEGIRKKGLADGLPRPTVGCIVLDLRSSVTDSELLGLANREGRLTPRVARKLARAVIRCRPRDESSSSS